MHRIATGLLIAAAVLVLNMGMLRDAFARDVTVNATPARVELAQPLAARSDKVLSLLLILESLRQTQLGLDGQKV